MGTGQSNCRLGTGLGSVDSPGCLGDSTYVRDQRSLQPTWLGVLGITLDASGGSLQLVESSSGGAQVETLETASGHCSDRESDQLDAELQTKSSLKRVPLLFSV